MKILFYSLIVLLLSPTFNIATPKNSLSVTDVISKNKNLSEFYKYLKKAQLDLILNKNISWNWTIFAPNNEAFLKLKKVNNDLLNDMALLRNLLMDHILIGEKSSKNLNKKMSNEKTVSNKPLNLYLEDELYVKDMVVINEDYRAINGIVHSIACVMFVQPSVDDDRLNDSIQKSFPVTSCCMRNEAEINFWKSSLKSR